MKNKIKSYDSEALFEYYSNGKSFISDDVMGAIAISEVKKPKRILKEEWNTLKLQTKKANILGEYTIEKGAPSFELIFSTYAVVPKDIIEDIRSNYVEGRGDWSFDDQSAMKKNLSLSETDITKKIENAVRAGALPESFFIGIGSSIHDKEAGIRVSAKVKQFIIEKTISRAEEKKNTKALSFDYTIEVSIGSTRTEAIGVKEFHDVAKKFALALEPLLLSDTTYFKFMAKPEPGSMLIKTAKVSITESTEQYTGEDITSMVWGDIGRPGSTIVSNMLQRVGDWMLGTERIGGPWNYYKEVHNTLSKAGYNIIDIIRIRKAIEDSVKKAFSHVFVTREKLSVGKDGVASIYNTPDRFSRISIITRLDSDHDDYTKERNAAYQLARSLSAKRINELKIIPNI